MPDKAGASAAHHPLDARPWPASEDAADVVERVARWRFRRRLGDDLADIVVIELDEPGPDLGQREVLAQEPRPA